MRVTLRRLLSTLAAIVVSTCLLVPPAHAMDEARFTAISLSGHTLVSGAPVTLSYSMSGTVPDQIELRFVESATGAIYTRRLVDVTAAGTALIGWSEGFPAGAYRLDELRIFEKSLFDPPIAYRSDGSIRREGALLGRHDLAFDDMYLAISGSETNVMTPPAVSAVRLAQAPAGVGDEVRVDVTTSDERAALAKVFVVWDSSQVDEVDTPTGSTTLTATPTAGRQETKFVSIFDKDGAFTVYYRDGSIMHGNTSRSAATYRWTSPRHHALDLTSLDLTVRPGPVTQLSASAASGAVRLMWQQPAAWGHRVTVSPGGRVLSAGVGGASREVVISGLPNGVRHSFAITTTLGDLESDPTSITQVPAMSPPRVFGTGDRSRDGRADLWAAPTVTNPASPTTWRIYQGTGTGRFGRVLTSSVPARRTPFPGSSTGRGPGASMGALYLDGGNLVEPTATGSKVVGKGFGIFRTIDASSDLTGDGVADLIGITPAGDFYLYTSTAAGSIGRGVRIGSGWGSFQSVFSPGDFNGDKRSDVVAVDGLGKLWLYPGNGRGGFGRRVLIGSGWNAFGSVFPMRDFSGDGKVDIGAITMDGKLRMYRGNGRGGFLASSQIGTGWGIYL